MLFRILGPVLVDGADGAGIALGGPRHRALLAALLISPGDVVSMDRLVEVLWGDEPPARASELVHVRISELRRALRDGGGGERELIVTRRPGYLLAIRSGELDAHRFARAAVDGRQALEDGRPDDAAAHLAEALGWWRGPALPELAERPLASAVIARWEHLREQAEADRVDAEIARGRHRDVLPDLEALVAEHPLDERHRARLMLALYRDGRQGDALAAYDGIAALLRDELGIDPGEELERVRLDVLRHDPALLGPASRRPRLPLALTSFVGRRAELAHVARSLHAARLVTLRGVGGAGKSRLAVEVARAVAQRFSDGAHLVDLAPVGEPALVSPTIAATLGVRERPREALTETLVHHLRDAHALLVLDNCEHLLDEVAPLVARLLGVARGLHVLATSRERLGVTGETVIAVEGLAVDGLAVAEAEDVVASPSAGVAASPAVADAVRLFVDRAAAVQPRFRLTAVDGPAVAEICRRLDGLPLPIEIAAARTAVLAPAQIAGRLGDRFRLLDGGDRAALPRHRTLRAVIDWSVDLLAPAERRVFTRLGVFAGGFTLDAAEAVCAEDGRTEERVARLVEKSLVVADAAGPEYRYRLLETLRAYALDALADRGDLDAVRAAHAAHYRDLAVAATDGMRTDRTVAWLDRLRTEHGNLRAAMEWSLTSGEDETAAVIAGATHKLWELEARYQEGRSWLRRVLEEGRSVPDAPRAWASFADAVLAFLEGDGDGTVTGCARAAAWGEACGDAVVVARARALQGFWNVATGDAPHGAATIAAAAEAAQEPWARAWALYFRSNVALVAGQWAEAVRDCELVQQLLGERGDLELRAWADLGLAQARLQLGEERRALACSVRAMRVFRELRVARGICFAVIPCTVLLVRQGGGAAAARLLAGGEAIRVRSGTITTPFIAAWVEEALVLLRTRLTPEELATEWRRGEAMTLDEVAEAALAELAELACLRRGEAAAR